MGISPEKAAEFLSDIGVDVLALNCGTGVDMAVAEVIISEYRDAGWSRTEAEEQRL
jgi:5-methyltetrahydrofolate--homocysteine methyltransferase